MQKQQEKTDVVVIGGGPAGLAAALSFEKQGLQVTVLDPAPESVLANPTYDGRDIALTHHSVSLMQDMGVWQRIEKSEVAPLNQARVENGRDDHPLTFDTKGKGKDALGYLVSNHIIRKALFEEVKTRTGITVLCEDQNRHLHLCSDEVQVEHNGLPIRAQLAVVADGRFSKTRESLGIGYLLHDFHRHMLVCRMEHDLPHHEVALQWFDEGQTVALLPLNGGKSSVVLSLPPDEMDRVAALDEEAFDQEIMRRVNHRLGNMYLISKRHVYPLKTIYANRFETRHTALIGDTAVGMHPITAHGFNLGLIAQDILSQEVAEGLARGEKLGSSKQLRRFERRLRTATLPLFSVTNGIATLYTREETPFWHLRRAAMHAANSLKPVKNRVVNMLMDKGVRSPL